MLNKILVNTKEKSLVLFINKKFYSKEVIEKTKDFVREYCSVEVFEAKVDDIFVVKIIPKNENADLGLLGYEFFNNMLFMTKRSRNL